MDPNPFRFSKWKQEKTNYMGIGKAVVSSSSSDSDNDTSPSKYISWDSPTDDNALRLASVGMNHTRNIQSTFFTTTRTNYGQHL